MLVIRCTQKLLRRLGAPTAWHNPKRPPPASTAPASTTRLGDWSANLIAVGPRRFVLALSERTRLPIVLPARDVKRLGEHLAAALPPVLRAIGVPDSAIQREVAEMRETVFAPTNSRSIVGTLTEFAWPVRWRVQENPDVDLTALSVELSDTPILALDDFPDRMTLKALDDGTAAGSGGPVAKIRTYRLKVTLVDSKPPIWRRFEVPADISLEQLHRVLQAVMGWTNSHLHEFEKGRVLYGVSDREFGVQRVSERKTRVGDLLTRTGATLDYEYDFGDSWSHRIVLEAVVESDARTARVLAGKRACPPEDVGGMWGYESFLEALADPKHPNHVELREWSGGGFDPEAFDVEAANRALARLRLTPPQPR